MIGNRFAAVPLVALLLICPRTSLADEQKARETNHEICTDILGRHF